MILYKIAIFRNLFTRALVMESLFYVYFRKWCSRASQIAFHDCQKNLQNHVFSRIVHLAGTRAPVIAVHWCSGRVLLAPESSLGAHGSSWWLLAEMYKNHWFIKQNLYFSSPRATLNVSHDLYSAAFKIHENHCSVDFWIQGQKTIKSSFMGLVLMTSGAKTRKSWHNITSKNICYRIIVHWVICSWILRLLLTEPAGDPRKRCVYAKVFPEYFVRRRCHITHFIVTCRVGTPRSVMS